MNMFILVFHAWQSHQRTMFFFFSFFFPHISPQNLCEDVMHMSMLKQERLKKHDQKTKFLTTQTMRSAHTIKVDNTVHLWLALTLSKKKMIRIVIHFMTLVAFYCP